MEAMRNGIQMENPEGLRMSHVFLVVLALHLVVIGGAFTYHHFRAKDNGADAVAARMEPGKAKPPSADSAAPAAAPAPAPALALKEPDATPAPVESRGETPVARAPDGAPGQPAAAPAAPAAPAARAPVAVAFVIHKVVGGDTIGRIARKHNVAPARLREVNGLRSDLIRVGQVLRVPAAAPVAAAAPAAPAPKPVAAAKPSPASAAGRETRGTVYTVAPGDTVTRIAEKFGVTPRQVIEANGITDPSKIRAGSKLTIPVEVSKAGGGAPSREAAGPEEPSGLAMARP